MKNRRTIQKNKFFSSFIPLIIILVVGGYIGGKILSSDKNEINNTENLINITNNIENKDQSNNTINIVNENQSNNIDNTVNNENTNSIDKSQQNEDKNIETNSKVAFIGDSRTQGFIMYNELKNVQDYSYIGLMVDTAVTKKFIKTDNGEKITLLEDMKNKDINRVYIMLGVNELGWVYPQVFKLKYGELVDKIKQVKPNCKIYLQSIIPVTKSRDKSDKIFNNKKINEFNTLIKEVSNEKNVEYLDVASALKDSEGYLPEEASTDGIHVGKKYCEKWLSYIKNNS